MFGRLLPREGRFFDLFNAHAGQVVRAVGGDAEPALVQGPGQPGHGADPRRVQAEGVVAMTGVVEA